jgi:hypothetical protein
MVGKIKRQNTLRKENNLPANKADVLPSAEEP